MLLPTRFWRLWCWYWQWCWWQRWFLRFVALWGRSILFFTTKSLFYNIKQHFLYQDPSCHLMLPCNTQKTIKYFLSTNKKLQTESQASQYSSLGSQLSLIFGQIDPLFCSIVRNIQLLWFEFEGSLEIAVYLDLPLSTWYLLICVGIFACITCITMIALMNFPSQSLPKVCTSQMVGSWKLSVTPISLVILC